MTGLIGRTSTIFIATGSATRVYRSMSDVPPPLRRRLQSSTTGINSATILIADKRGQEELVRALRDAPSELWSLLASTRSRQLDQTAKPARRRYPSLRTWLEMLLPVAVGASLWLLIDSHY